uniref:Uncharacterized protein n=1 Tax=Arundo donax TaxID=35708 RepID=A0A0A9B6D6_ARUDO
MLLYCGNFTSICCLIYIDYKLIQCSSLCLPML